MKHDVRVDTTQDPVILYCKHCEKVFGAWRNNEQVAEIQNQDCQGDE